MRIGSVAPDFSVTTTTGKNFRYTSEGATRPMLLEVFATWCVHCAHMAPVISKLYAKYGARVDVIGASGSPFAIDSKSSESEEDVIAWAKKVHAFYPVAFDESGAVAHRYLAHGYPLIVIVDSYGTVQSVGSGEIPYAALDHQLGRVLAEQKPDP